MDELCRTITSECGKYKVEIVRRSESAFQIIAWKLRPGESIYGFGPSDPYWAPASRLATFTDTIENAERLANEAIGLMLGSFRNSPPPTAPIP